MNDRTALGVRERAGARDSAGYVRRNLATAYRLASVVLDDPVLAQTVVHHAAMRAWDGWGWKSASALDAAFRRELDSGCRAMLPSGGEDATGLPRPAEPLVAAIGALSARDRCSLAREYGPVRMISPDANAPLGIVTRHLARRRTAALLGRLLRSPAAVRAGSGTDDPSVPTRLRAVYASRDPGPDVPLDLRLRLNRSLAEAEVAADTRADRDRAAGWRFAIDIFLLLVAGAVALSLVSVTAIRASAQATAGNGDSPTTPLTITSVSVLPADVNGAGVHVAATRDSLVATFQGPAVWHASARQCLPDVSGTIDRSGRAQWPGPAAGHVESMAADPTAGSVFAAGLGEYCDPGARVSADGGATWTDGKLPSGSSGGVAWLGYDPAHAGTLVAVAGGVLSVSRDAGLTWSGGPLTVDPVAFAATGRLFGWSPGALFESIDDGGSWQQIGTGPKGPPAAGAAVPGGLLLGGSDGAWLYPVDSIDGMDGASDVVGKPALIHRGAVYSIAAAGDGAVLLGGDAVGRAWLGTYSARAAETAVAPDASVTPVPLPMSLAGVIVAGGQVAANGGGTAVALTWANPGAAGTYASAILYAAFAH